ncbi:unnamed protein product [Rotaria sp. Silwood2]|nr:unnamed protein product [Rotaria sp. Silwood2]
MLRIKQEVASSAASDKLVPLKQVRVDTKIHSFAADVTITQIFQNDESVPVEAVYCFPVEENAAIYGFVARIDDEREIVAQIKEKKAAQQEYTQALAQGHGAYLLEQDEASNDIFIISVGAYVIVSFLFAKHPPSRALVKGLARATNGYFNFIAPHTNVDIYVAEQLSRALQPSIADVYVKWNTNQRILHKVPEHAPPVFVGDRLLFYALLDETMPFDHTTTVELFTGIQQQPIGLARVDHVPSVLGSQLVMHLAAKALLRELSDDQKTIDKELLVNISIKYGILCPYTAFIGVERRLDVNSESNVDMELREVSIMISKTCRESVTRFRALSSTSSLRYQSLSSDINRLKMDMCCNIESIAQRDNDLSIIIDHCCELDTSSK